MQRSRIVVVEDEKDYLDTLAMILEREGYVVKGVQNLEDAGNLLDREVFHVALVDIMLAGPKDRKNQDGLKVLEKLIQLGEGTRAIVLTAQDAPQFAADVSLKYKIFDYIDKRAITDKRPLLAKVSKAADAAHIVRYVGGGAIDFLAKGDETWVSNVLRVLKVRGGYDALRDFLSEFCDPLAPLLPRAGQPRRMTLDQQKNITFGTFWSKSLGEPISLVMCRKDEYQGLLSDRLPEWTGDPVVVKASPSGVIGVVFKLVDASRADFVPDTLS